MNTVMNHANAHAHHDDEPEAFHTTYDNIVGYNGKNGEVHSDNTDAPDNRIQVQTVCEEHEYDASVIGSIDHVDEDGAAKHVYDNFERNNDDSSTSKVKEEVYKAMFYESNDGVGKHNEEHNKAALGNENGAEEVH